jgi:hypothetical protein
VARYTDPRRRDFLKEVIGRPVMFVFWSLMVWGALYGALFVWRAVTSGVGTTWRQALSDGDALGGRINLGLAGCAAPVWALVALAIWRTRRRGQRE